ncbi:hypothetical protein [Flammeovirga kamogawensis]|uniref:Bacteriocin n=1 Tax=Flammeovirga kamogawensis TaxID=373891 RepID=A0ABX8H183_9BACT|nr:hypothetical protein [Flammeovirga kamogawensis]MBB6462253.1 hypothetical protein [Flammeovirga kamogawensis]QWG09347.1 hypothetical protein KM029_22335 [Flammeovirga kamogawensis]TRX64869.1 hypothetical protein EO216_20250 [Flammeovirga kamogawensis]
MDFIKSNKDLKSVAKKSIQAEELFEKRIVVELSDEELSNTKGGTSPSCIVTVLIPLTTIIPNDALSSEN